MSKWCDHELMPGKDKMWAGMWECSRCGKWVKQQPAATNEGEK